MCGNCSLFGERGACDRHAVAVPRFKGPTESGEHYMRYRGKVPLTATVCHEKTRECLSDSGDCKLTPIACF